MSILSEILGLIDQCIDELIWAMFLYGAIGLAVGLLLILIGRKKGLFRRKHVVMRLLVGAYQIFIPLLFAYTTGALGAVWTAEKFTKEQVHSEITPLTKTTFPAYQMFLQFNWNRITGSKMNFHETMEEYLDFIGFQPEKDTWKEIWKAKLANEIVPKVATWSMEAVVHAARRIAEEEAAKVKESETPVTTALALARSMDIDNYKKRYWELVEEETNERIHGFYIPFYKTILHQFLFLMIIPCLEILVFIITRRK